MSIIGYIGGFYFGPVSETATFGVLSVSATLLQPTITIVNSISGTPNFIPLKYWYELLQPTIYTTTDLEIDFVGVPLKGSTPLQVQYTATVNFSPEFTNKYIVSEYRWCFNYDYTNNVCLEDWVVTTENPITHIYTGYRGQQYSVKLCVTLELK